MRWLGAAELYLLDKLPVLPSSGNYPLAHLFFPTKSSKQELPKLATKIKIGGKHPRTEQKEWQ